MLHRMPRNHLFHNLRTIIEFCSQPMLWGVLISFHMIIQFYLIHSQGRYFCECHYVGGENLENFL